MKEPARKPRPRLLRLLVGMDNKTTLFLVANEWSGPALDSRCTRPLAGDELERIAGSIGGYKPARELVSHTLTATPLAHISMRSIEWLEKPLWQRSAFQLLAGQKAPAKAPLLQASQPGSRAQARTSSSSQAKTPAAMIRRPRARVQSTSTCSGFSATALTHNETCSGLFKPNLDVLWPIGRAKAAA